MASLFISFFLSGRDDSFFHYFFLAMFPPLSFHGVWVGILKILSFWFCSNNVSLLKNLLWGVQVITDWKLALSKSSWTIVATVSRRKVRRKQNLSPQPGKISRAPNGPDAVFIPHHVPPIPRMVCSLSRRFGTRYYLHSRVTVRLALNC